MKVIEGRINGIEVKLIGLFEGERFNKEARQAAGVGAGQTTMFYVGEEFDSNEDLINNMQEYVKLLQLSTDEQEKITGIGEVQL